MPYFPNYFKKRGTVKAKLLKDTFTGQDTAEYVDDVVSDAATGTNVADITPTISSSVTDGIVYWSITDVDWTNVTSTNVGYVVLYVDTGNTATSPVISYADIREGGSGRAITTSDLTVTYPANDFRFHVW